MGTNFYGVEKSYKINRKMIHIGKRSAGWKFLFQGYMYEDEYSPKIQNIEEMKQYLKDNNMIIYDEYDNEMEEKDFWKMVEELQKEDNEDDFTYNLNINGYRFSFRDFS